jgi:hypothetical protein
VRFGDLLGRSVRGFWATTYSLDLKLFDQYLLRHLAQSKLNAVILADHDKLASTWELLGEDSRHLAHQVGRRYLLRGIRPPGGGAFHPKTYLFVRADGAATLLVGSGNLTRGGVNHGHEVFTTFSSQQEDDLTSMRAWSAWTSALVEHHGDGLLRDRWVALRESCPWLIGPSGDSQFLDNSQRTLLDQLAERLPRAVAELHVTAPFFDREAAALRAVIETCRPERTVLYVGPSPNVHGPSLSATLRDAGDFEVRRWEPRSFVHAKLIGAIGSNGEGILLSGSPNLSRAALTRVYAKSGGNCETAILRSGDGEQVRTCFEGGSRLRTVSGALSEIDTFEYEEDRPGTARPVALTSARWDEDGHIVVAWSGADEPPQGTGLAWGEPGQPAALEGNRSVEPLVAAEPTPMLVWLTDASGAPISNRVAIDDPKALQQTLTGSDRAPDARPAELQDLDASPLVRIALWVNERFIFDPGESSALRRAQDAAGAEDQGAEDSSGFWERYAREELQHDPRSHTYRPLTPGGHDATPVDELMRELEILLHTAPNSPANTLRILTALPEDSGQAGEGPGSGSPWTMEARQRVRVYNLLTRWSNAVADPQLNLLSTGAAAINYQTLLAVILATWLHDAFDRARLRKLLLVLLRAFIGQGNGKGFLGRAPEAEREDALGRLDPVALEIGAGLVATAFSSSWRSDIYDWQPVVRRALELEAIAVGQWSTLTVERLAPGTLDAGGIQALLEERIAWVDEDTWCKRLAGELELDRIALDLRRNATVRAAVHVKGVTDPLGDGRLLTVARRTLEFKHLPAIAVICEGAGTLIFEPGKRARALLGGHPVRSTQPVTAERIAQIERHGGSWADLLELEAAA